MSTVGYATLSVIPSLRGVAGTLASEADEAGGGAATAFSGRWNRVLSGGLIAGSVIAATGAGLIAIGSQFDDAFDTIETGTGATGRALEGLKDVFRDVASDVPADFGDIADAVTLVNQRLELTGRPLQRLSTQFLNLARITDTDLRGNIDSVTQAFGDWSIATEGQSAALDRFFRASQLSGVGVQTLAEGVVNFGAPLRSLGFSMDESIALFASFGESGVNTSKVMAGLTLAATRFGSGMAETTLGVSDFSEVMVGVADGTFTATDAITLFGQRAGQDVYRAILEGRFALDDYVDAMRNTGDGINATADATADFGESFTLLKNNILLLLEGPATGLMGFLSDAAEGMADLAQTIREEGFGAGLEEIVDNFGEMSGAAQVATAAVAGLALAFAAVKIQAALAWIAAAAPAAAVLALVLAIGVGTAYVITNLDTLDAGIQTTSDNAEANVPGIADAFDVVGEALNQVLGSIFDIPNAIGVVIDIIQGDFAGAWDRVVDHWMQTFGRIPRAVGAVLGLLGPIMGSAMEAIGSAMSNAWSGIVQVVVTAMGTVKDRVQTGIFQVTSFLRAFPGQATSAIASIASNLPNKMREAVQGMLNAARSVGATIVSFFGGLPGKIVGALGSLKSLLFNAGRQIIEGLLNGIRAAAGGLLSYVSGLASDIASTVSGVLGIFSPSRVMEEIGGYTMEGLELGMRAGWQRIVSWLRGLDPGSVIFGGDPFGSVFDLDLPALQSLSSLLDVQDGWRAIRRLFADMPYGFIAGTQAGNDFVRALMSQAANIRNYVDALVASGDFSGATAALTRMIGTLRQMATTAGLSATAIGQLIDDLFGGLNPDALLPPPEPPPPVDPPAAERESIRVVVEANGVDAALVEWLRRSVRVESGGDVQAYLGTR